MAANKQTEVVAAHVVTEQLTIAFWYPAHAPRRGSIEDRMFRETKQRLKKAGAHQCWINNRDCGGGPLELHHDLIENALIQAVSVEHFIALYPEFGITDEETFVRWTQSEGNLLFLCPNHHRGQFGIHSILYSPWVLQRFLRDDAQAPATAVLTPHAKLKAPDDKQNPS